MTTSYLPGALSALVGPRTVIVLSSAPASEPVNTVWPVVGADAAMDVVVGKLFGVGIAQISALGFVHDVDGVTVVIVRGPIVADVRFADGRSEQVSGERVATWTERVFEHVVEVTIRGGAVAADGGMLPIGSGIVLADAVRRGYDGAADPIAISPQQPVPPAQSVTPAQPAPPAQSVPPAQPAPAPQPLADPVPLSRPPAQPAAPAQPVARPAPAMPPPATPVPVAPAGGFHQPPPSAAVPGRMLIDRLDLAAIEPEPVPAPMPVFEAVERQPFAAPPAPGGDHDARTRPSQRPPGGPVGQPARQELRVYAVACARGHDNPPTAVTCRVCDLPIDEDQVPTEISQPTVGRLRQLSTNADHPLRGLVLVGREPRLERRDTVLGDASSLAEVSLFVIDSPDGLVSRTHLEVRVTGWMVEVVDVSSSHTEVTMPGLAPVRLRPDQPTMLVPGARLVLADEITLQFEVTG